MREIGEYLVEVETEATENGRGWLVNGGYDVVKFGKGIIKEDISFDRIFGNLYLQFGENVTIKIHNQYENNDKTERFELADGSFLTDSDEEQVMNIVSSAWSRV